MFRFFREPVREHAREHVSLSIDQLNTNLARIKKNLLERRDTLSGTGTLPEAESKIIEGIDATATLLNYSNSQMAALIELAKKLGVFIMVRPDPHLMEIALLTAILRGEPFATKPLETKTKTLNSGVAVMETPEEAAILTRQDSGRLIADATTRAKLQHQTNTHTTPRVKKTRLDLLLLGVALGILKAPTLEKCVVHLRGGSDIDSMDEKSETAYYIKFEYAHPGNRLPGVIVRIPESWVHPEALASYNESNKPHPLTKASSTSTIDATEDVTEKTENDDLLPEFAMRMTELQHINEHLSKLDPSETDFTHTEETLVSELQPSDQFRRLHIGLSDEEQLKAWKEVPNQASGMLGSIMGINILDPSLFAGRALKPGVQTTWLTEHCHNPERGYITPWPMMEDTLAFSTEDGQKINCAIGPDVDAFAIGILPSRLSSDDYTLCDMAEVGTDADKGSIQGVGIKYHQTVLAAANQFYIKQLQKDLAEAKKRHEPEIKIQHLKTMIEFRIMMMHHAAEVLNPKSAETRKYMDEGVGCFLPDGQVYFFKDRHAIIAAFRAFSELKESERPLFHMSEEFYGHLNLDDAGKVISNNIPKSKITHIVPMQEVKKLAGIASHPPEAAASSTLSRTRRNALTTSPNALLLKKFGSLLPPEHGMTTQHEQVTALKTILRETLCPPEQEAELHRMMRSCATQTQVDAYFTSLESQYNDSAWWNKHVKLDATTKTLSMIDNLLSLDTVVGIAEEEHASASEDDSSNRGSIVSNRGSMSSVDAGPFRHREPDPAQDDDTNSTTSSTSADSALIWTANPLLAYQLNSACQRVIKIISAFEDSTIQIDDWQKYFVSRWFNCEFKDMAYTHLKNPADANDALTELTKWLKGNDSDVSATL